MPRDTSLMRRSSSRLATLEKDELHVPPVARLRATGAKILRMPPVVIVSGSPASGKSTLALALARRFERSVCIPVDDLRDWVVSGRADSFPEWSEETALQYAIAEDAAADLAWRYHESGFAVVLDHCRLPENIDLWVERSLHGLPVSRVALAAPVETALLRNAERSNKSFDTSILDPMVRSLAEAYIHADLPGWIVTPNLGNVEEEVDGVYRALMERTESSA